MIEKLGSAVQGYREGLRVIAGAITPSGYSNACLCGCLCQDGAGTKHGFKAIGGWKFGNTIDGCQAEYVRVPDAMANLALVPDNLTDEQVLMCPDIMSTGFSGAESGKIRIGDTVAVFAQGRSACAPPPALGSPARPQSSRSMVCRSAWRYLASSEPIIVSISGKWIRSKKLCA